MRLYLLEIKRILKSRRTMTLLVIAFILSVVMSYLPVTFYYINIQKNKDGSYTSLSGMKALAYIKAGRNSFNGEVTPEKLKKALITYQSLIREYGSVDNESFPLDVYWGKISPIRGLLGKLPEAYANPRTGIGADLMDIDPNNLDHFYDQCTQHLKNAMLVAQKDYPSAQQQAAKQYAKVATPFQLYDVYSMDAFDYFELFIFLCILLCVAIAAPIFSDDYQTGSDSILRCTKHGRTRLAVVKVLAPLTIFTITFAICIFLHLLVSNLTFGPESGKTSLQMLSSVAALPNLNIDQTQLFLALGGYLSLLACISFTLFLSSKCKESLSGLLISLVSCLIPSILYKVFGFSWCVYLFPAGGIGLVNNLFYQLSQANYLHIGQLSFWTPYVILLIAVIEIPLFVSLAIHTYCQHQVA